MSFRQFSLYIFNYNNIKDCFQKIRLCTKWFKLHRNHVSQLRVLKKVHDSISLSFKVDPINIFYCNQIYKIMYYLQR